MKIKEKSLSKGLKLQCEVLYMIILSDCVQNVPLLPRGRNMTVLILVKHDHTGFCASVHHVCHGQFLFDHVFYI